MILNKPQKITKEKVNPNLAYCRNLKIGISIFYPMRASSSKMPQKNIPAPLSKSQTGLLAKRCFRILAVLSTRNPGLQRGRQVLSLCNRVLPCERRLGLKSTAAAGLIRHLHVTYRQKDKKTATAKRSLFQKTAAALFIP